MAAIEVAALSKVYTYHHKASGLRGSLRSLFKRETLAKRAVDGIDFTIQSGEIVGFLGANGAGKTTTLKLLCGLLYPTEGSARVLGFTPHRRDHAFLRRIALVMGQKFLLYNDLPAMEVLQIHRELYGLGAAEFRRNLDELVSLLGVRHLLEVQVRKLSLGERMKMELLAALVHRPEVLFLDEPTIGLDAVSQVRMREFLRRLNRDLGTTILLTSHYMEDIRALCPRALVIHQGQLRHDGATEPGLALMLRLAAELHEEEAAEMTLTAVSALAPADVVTTPASAAGANVPKLQSKLPDASAEVVA
jgi:ABC-2 type transport system ATP-binding protein